MLFVPKNCPAYVPSNATWDSILADLNNLSAANGTGDNSAMFVLNIAISSPGLRTMSWRNAPLTKKWPSTPHFLNTLKISLPYALDSASCAQITISNLGIVGINSFIPEINVFSCSTSIALPCSLLSSICNDKFVERISSASLAINSLSISNLAARSFAWDADFSASFARSFASAAVLMAEAASLSLSEASYNSYVKPITRSAIKNFFHLACLPTSSVQSKYTSPATPTRTAIKPGCLLANSPQFGNQNTDATEHERSTVKKTVFIALTVFIGSEFSSVFKRKSH